jgi:sugar/nucleoside kinase (ribokinase family)
MPASTWLPEATSSSSGSEMELPAPTGPVETSTPAPVPAPAVAAVDVTGAGDAFAAGYLVALAGGAELAEAARAGNLLAARAVATEGPWPAETHRAGGILPGTAEPRYP